MPRTVRPSPTPPMLLSYNILPIYSIYCIYYKVCYMGDFYIFESIYRKQTPIYYYNISYYFYYYIYTAKLFGNSGNSRTSLPVAVQQRPTVGTYIVHHIIIIIYCRFTHVPLCAVSFFVSLIRYTYLLYKNMLGMHTIFCLLMGREDHDRLSSHSYHADRCWITINNIAIYLGTVAPRARPI